MHMHESIHEYIDTHHAGKNKSALNYMHKHAKIHVSMHIDAPTLCQKEKRDAPSMAKLSSISVYA